MNVLVVEDESFTASLLKEIVEQDPEFKVIEIVESVMEAVQYLSKYQKSIDLCFFDIQLADGQSFEIFKHIDVVVPIVFCTAYDEYTLQAIKSNGIDYVLKPFKEEEIHAALQKYKRFIASLQSKSLPPISFQTEKPKSYQQRFLIQYREKTLIKPIEEIALFMVENDMVYIYTFAGQKFTLLKKMEYLESACAPNQFFRINRQMLINREAITSFEPHFNRKIVLNLKVKLSELAIVSRLKVSSFKTWLEQ
ncbi:MAG: LytTR family DNA-binding domain-containing protein [Bacteroidota bacterium]